MLLKFKYSVPRRVRKFYNFIDDLEKGLTKNIEFSRFSVNANTLSESFI